MPFEVMQRQLEQNIVAATFLAASAGPGKLPPLIQHGVTGGNFFAAATAQAAKGWRLLPRQAYFRPATAAVASCRLSLSGQEVPASGSRQCRREPVCVACQAAQGGPGSFVSDTAIAVR